MASVLHGNARTTPHLRAEFQASKESSGPLPPAYGLNEYHNGRRAHGSEEAEEHGADTGRGGHRGGVPAEDAAALDDVLGCLRDAIPDLSRSALHRCLQRHGVSRLPIEETKEQRKRFKTYEIGYVHIIAASCATPTASSSCSSPSTGFPSSPTSSSTTAGKVEGSAFLSNAMQVFPYKIHTVLTNNGMAFADLPRTETAPAAASWTSWDAPDVVDFFANPPADLTEPGHHTTDADHGRIEERRHVTCHKVDWLLPAWSLGGPNTPGPASCMAP